MLFIKQTRVYTRFLWNQLAYRSVKNKFCRTYQIYKLTQISSISSSDLSKFFIISFADHPRDSSFLDLEILNLHHIHRYIIDSDLSINSYPFHPDILQSEVFIKPRPMHTLALWSSSPYIYLAFVNTMSQNHSTTDGIPRWDQIDNPALNTVGQYHGNVP